jgi:SpoVK/Ycf46/Vps4 family AAA+-type ATPase
MPQTDLIKDIAKFGLENDQENLYKSLLDLIEYFKNHKKVNLAIQLQSLVKEALKAHANSGMVKVGSPKYLLREEDKELGEFIIDKITSEYRFNNLVCSDSIKHDLQFFIEEHQCIQLLRKYDLPVSNKVIFHGPSGCGKTLAAYVLAGELQKIMVVVNLGAIVSSKLGETSKNLAKIFKQAASEECIIFIDEFDSLGKIRDYNQDHGEMKRVVNTILQLFDYLPQNSLVIAATNQIDMIDEALVRRFDLKLQFELPDREHIKEIISKTLEKDQFTFDDINKLPNLIRQCNGLSYFSIQRTLITSIKKGVINKKRSLEKPKINTELWSKLIAKEKQSLKKKITK